MGSKIKLVGKAVLGTVGGLTGYIAGNYYIDKATSTALHIDVPHPRLEKGGINIFPIMAAVYKAMPVSMRESIQGKGNAPKELDIPDWYDYFGENPYKIEEVVKDKVWMVKYKAANFMAFGPEAKAFTEMFGLEYSDEKVCENTIQGAAKFGEKAAAQVVKDLEMAKAAEKLKEEQGKTKETVKAVGPFSMNMAVVKLNSGDLLLYSPVRVRDEFEFGSWLEKLGPVKWIVTGSSAHTMTIPSILKRYPDVKYVAPRDAWMKLKHFEGIGKEKPEYDYTNISDLERLNKELADEGVKFYWISGDCATSTVVGVAHNTALEVDLVYSNCNGLSKEVMEDEELFNERLFKWNLMTSPNSPNNALPPYRFWMMDPTNPMSAQMQSPPKKDGSSCTDMAASLRKLLKEDIDHAVGVHANYLTGEDFKKSMDMNWNWLDGKSLLED